MCLISSGMWNFSKLDVFLNLPKCKRQTVKHLYHHNASLYKITAVWNLEQEWQNSLAQSLAERRFRLGWIRYSVGILSIFHVLARNDIYFNFNFFLDDLRLLSLTEHALNESFSALEELHCKAVLLLKMNRMVCVCLTWTVTSYVLLVWTLCI